MPAAVPEKDGAGLAAFLRAYEQKDLLRFITCGSVDDGKSTLIGRLLYDSKQIFDDHLTALEKDSAQVGTVAGGMDFALLLDGLAAEREQGITIDVAYRFFATEKRKFIVADTPGHEQYTRNMATGASTADLAILLIDARKGVLTQTRRHSQIVALMGIRQVVLAVNKMDLVDYAQDVFTAIESDYRAFAQDLGLSAITAIPLSALQGDNVFSPSAVMPWYPGPTLMEHLEAAPAQTLALSAPFRLPVQWVNRPHLDFRGFAGTIAQGVVRVGDALRIAPSGRQTALRRIMTFDGDVDAAQAGQAVTLVLADEVDVSRGDVLCAAHAPPVVSDRGEAQLIWMADAPLQLNQEYIFQYATARANARITQLQHRLEVNSGATEPAATLGLNDIGRVRITLDRPLPLAPYQQERALGAFILIDRLTHATLAAGMIANVQEQHSALFRHNFSVGKAQRALAMEQRPCVLWFTGYSGSGKSTIADLLEKKLAQLGYHTYTLDGDNVRLGLCKDLSFSAQDRKENIRRVGEVAKLMLDAGLIVLTSFISPFRDDRALARDLMQAGEFFEIFIDTPLDVCMQRDPKGLYEKAKAGKIKDFTGVDSPYEPPENPELVLRTTEHSAEELADGVITFLAARGYLG